MKHPLFQHLNQLFDSQISLLVYMANNNQQTFDDVLNVH
jgi:hypothetical protein